MRNHSGMNNISGALEEVTIGKQTGSLLELSIEDIGAVMEGVVGGSYGNGVVIMNNEKRQMM